MLNIQIDDIQYPIEMIAGFTQDYQKIYNTTTHRAIDGTPYRQSTWNKLVTTISGNSWIPAPIMSLDFDTSHTLKCASPISVVNTNRVITIPGTFRLDSMHEPKAYYFYNDTLNSCNYSLAGNVATVEDIPSALYYVIDYCPIVSVLIDPPKQSLDSNSSSYSWSITATEV